MKKPFNGIPDFRKKAEPQQEEEIPLRTCMVCKKPTLGYGCFQEGYVCSRKCNEAYEKSRPSLIDYVIGEHHEQVVRKPDSGAGSDGVSCEGERTETSP